MALVTGGNVNPAGQPPTGSTSGSSALRPAAKRRLETGTVSLEFLPGGEVVNLDVDLHLHVLRILLFVLQKHQGYQYLHLNLDLDQHDQQQNLDLQPHQLLRGGKLQVLFRLNFYLEGGGVNLDVFI